MNANNKENKVLLQCTPTPLSLFIENIKVETSRIESIELKASNQRKKSRTSEHKSCPLKWLVHR